MSEIMRVIDTGLRRAEQNIALARALLEARQAEEVPSTLRFLRFTPAALLGSNQSAEQEFNLEYCRAHNISVQRRITGGGAIYTNETQLDWEICLHRRDVGSVDLSVISKRICHAAATAISAFGIDARFRSRNEIEVDGRTILRGGGVFDGNALLYHGTLLIDFDIEDMLHVLRIPAGRLSEETIASMRNRVTSLKDLTGHRADPVLIKRYLTEAFESEFDAEFREADVTLTEHERYLAAVAEIDTPDWAELVNGPVSDTPICTASIRCSGRMLRASLIYDRPRHRIRQIRFEGDIDLSPRRTVADLEASLLDTSVERLEHNVRVFFRGRCVDMPLLTPRDFVEVTRLAAKQPIIASSRA